MKRLSLITAAILFAVYSFAQLSIWDGTDDVWTKGAGTESSPYLIESAQQLAFIASMVNGGVTTYENTYFKLMTNIDLNNLTWEPIGSSETNCFKGHFDGNNKTIQNSQVTLFGYIKAANIGCLNVEMRGLIGNAENSYISHISSRINIFQINPGSANQIWESIGGIIVTATNCVVQNSECRIVMGTGVYAERQCGGVVAKAINTQIKACRVYGNINAVGNGSGHKDYDSHCGGIVGFMNGGNVSNSSNRCLVLGGWASGSSIGTDFSAGGIIGGGTGVISVDNCIGLDSVAYGWMDGQYERTSFAGLCGLPIYGSNISINNSFTCMKEYYPAPHLNRLQEVRRGYISITNTYTRSDKTESAMKSASFPIILNTDSTVFISDVSPNVNNGYPIYVNQVYTITDSISTIDFTSTQLLGHFYALNADSVGFEYKESADNTHWYKSVTAQAAGNVVTYDLSDLTTGTNYIYRLWVECDGVRYFGDVLSFKTLECSQTITPISASICQGEEYFFNEQHLTKSGTYRDTLIASNGCDSIVELTLTVMSTANIEKYDTIMVGENYDFYGDILTESGTYEHYVPMANKCNLIIMHLYVRQPSVVVTATSADEKLGSVEGGGTYEKYSQVTLTAISNIGCKFVKWTDDNTENPRIITPTEDCSYTAVFEQIQYTLTVTSADTQKGNVSGGGQFTYGQQAPIVATPNEGYSFKKWSDGDTNASRTITIVSDSNLVASFEEIKCTLTLTANNSSMGSVSGAGVYTYGSEVTILATPNTGHQFVNWSDNDVNASRTFIITRDMSLTANFEALKYMVTATSNDETLGTVYGGGEYAYNAQASLMAVPNTNCEFVTWNNGVITNPYVFAVTENVTIQAIFRHTGEGIEDVDANSTPQKFIQDGQIFILRGDKTYTITGAEVK